MEPKDYYRILGIEKDASAKEVKESYRNLAFKYHPDRCSDPEAIDRMKDLNEAYAVLSNTQKRSEYDSLRQRFGSSAYGQFRSQYSDRDIFSGSDIHHIFEEMTRVFGFRSFDDIFKDFEGQGYQRFEVRRPGMHATGFVFTGKTGRGLRREVPSILPGNLGGFGRNLLRKLTNAVIPENGADRMDDLVLAPIQALQGGKFKYYHREQGKDLVVTIPPGVREGQLIRLTGMGKGGKDGGKSGDLYLKVRIRASWIARIQNFFRQIMSRF